MPRSRAIVGALDGFLGTYTSRYSDYDGYWLFGFLVSGPEEVKLDLAAEQPNPAPEGAMALAEQLAREKFKDQVVRSGLEERLAGARLTIARQPGMRRGFVDGHACDGHEIVVRASARMDTGREYQRERALFVAAHDPTIESRSARASA